MLLVGDAGVRLRPVADKFAAEADDQISGNMSALAKKAAGFFAAAFAAVQIGGFLVESVNQAVDLQESTSKVGVVFGAAAEDVKAFAATAASSMGLSEAAALGAVGTFGNLLRSTGLAEDASADMSTSMVTLAGDLASFNNASPEETLEALRAGLLGEAEPLKKFGVNLNAAAIEAKALALGLIEEDEAMTDAQKATAAHALIMEQTALAQGDFGRTSDGLANQQRILAAEFDDVKASIGNALLPTLQTLAGFVLDTVLPGVKSLAAGFEQNFQPAVDAVVAVVRDEVIPAIQTMAQFISDNEGPITVIAGIIAALFIPHLIALGVEATISAGKQVAAWIATKAQAIIAAAVHSAQIAWMILRWIAIGAAAVLHAGITVGAWIGMGLAAVVHATAIAAVWTAQTALAGLRIVGGWILTAASVALSWAGMALSATANAIRVGAIWLAQTALTTGALLLGWGIAVAGVVAGWTVMAAQSLLAAARMAAAWFIALGPIGWAIGAIIGLVALVIANWETVKSVTVGAFNAVVGAVTGAFNSVVGAVSSGISSVLGFFSALPGRIVNAIGNLGNLLVGAGRALMQGFVNGVSNAADFVGDLAGNIWRAARGFINSNVIDRLNNLLEFTIMGVKVNPPDIPRLHSGGVFTSGNASGEGLAILRDNETVVTPEARDRAAALLAAAGGLTGRAGTATTAGGGSSPITIEEHIYQAPGEPIGAVAARVTQSVVWNLNGGITRRIGAGATT